MKALAKRVKTRRDELAWLAWHTAALPMMKKFPRLDELMGNKRTLVPQDHDQMLDVMKRAFGYQEHGQRNNR